MSEGHACLWPFVQLTDGTGAGFSQKEAEDAGDDGEGSGWDAESSRRGALCCEPSTPFPPALGPWEGTLGDCPRRLLASSWFGQWEAPAGTAGGRRETWGVIPGISPLGVSEGLRSCLQPLPSLCAQILEATPSLNRSVALGAALGSLHLVHDFANGLIINLKQVT